MSGGAAGETGLVKIGKSCLLKPREDSYLSPKRLRSRWRNSSSLKGRTFILSLAEEAGFEASDFFSRLDAVSAASALTFFFLDCITPSLTAFLETLERRYLKFSS